MIVEDNSRFIFGIRFVSSWDANFLTHVHTILLLTACVRGLTQLKTSLKAHANSDWTSHLLWVLLVIRSSLKENLGYSSAQLVLGSSVRLPGQYFEFRKYKFDSHFDYFHRLNKFIHSLRAILLRLCHL